MTHVHVTFVSDPVPGTDSEDHALPVARSTRWTQYYLDERLAYLKTPEYSELLKKVQEKNFGDLGGVREGDRKEFPLPFLNFRYHSSRSVVEEGRKGKGGE
jgi:hypothetical protein